MRLVGNVHICMCGIGRNQSQAHLDRRRLSFFFGTFRLVIMVTRDPTHAQRFR